MDHGALKRAEPNRVTVADALIYEHLARIFHPQPGRLNIKHLQQLVVVFIEQQRSARQRLQLHRAADVVDVSVCYHDLRNPQVMPAEDLQDSLDLIARVNHDRFVRIFVANHRTITLQRAYREDFVNHDLLWDGARGTGEWGCHPYSNPLSDDLFRRKVHFRVGKLLNKKGLRVGGLRGKREPYFFGACCVGADFVPFSTDPALPV